MCFSYRRCQQTLLQAICYAGRSAKGEPSGSQGPVPPRGVLSPAARGHPYPTPQPREASAVPPAAPPPLPAKAAAGLWHLCHSPGEAAVQSCLGEGDGCARQPEERLLLPLLSDIRLQACFEQFCLLRGATVPAATAGGTTGSQGWGVLAVSLTGVHFSV